MAGIARPLEAPGDGLMLVPGGAGFVGSHLCDRLIARGFRVLALDDLSTATGGTWRISPARSASRCACTT